MGTYKGGFPTYRSLRDNLDVTKNNYDYKNGYFGNKGKSSVNDIREIYSDDQFKEAKSFYDKITYGGIETPLANDKGLITKLKDGTIITYREITSTINSPAVEINIRTSKDACGIKNQKIHFEGSKKKW